MDAGKLLCVGVRGAVPGEPELENDLDACARAGVGGVILFDVDVPSLKRFRAEGHADAEARRRAVRNIQDPQQVRNLTAHIRQRLGADVFVGVDQEGGQVARLAPARGFSADPSAVEFAAYDDIARRSAALNQARQLAELGFDLNFAPCVDLALESDNAIVTALGRAYSAEPAAAIECAEIVLEAHAAAGVAACLKHFPGHGSSRGDTHLGVVDITKTWEREKELAPYRRLIGQPGLAVMAAHVIHRGLAGETPASLSSAIITGILRDELDFDGVVVTDSIDMGAVADRYEPGAAAVAAVIAGADFVVDGFNLSARDEHPAPIMARALTTAAENGQIPDGEGRVAQSVSRLERLRAEIKATT